MKNASKISVHLKILIGYYYLSGLLFLFSGIALIFSPDLITNSFISNFGDNWNENHSLWLGIGLIILALIDGIIGFKISKRSKGFRLIAAILSILGLLWALVAVFFYQDYGSLFFLIIHIYFLWILKFNYR